ncbi:MAG: hypothetical protein AAFP77_15690 [Bacteroidota bacterium]
MKNNIFFLALFALFSLTFSCEKDSFSDAVETSPTLPTTSFHPLSVNDMDDWLKTQSTSFATYQAPIENIEIATSFVADLKSQFTFGTEQTMFKGLKPIWSLAEYHELAEGELLTVPLFRSNADLMPRNFLNLLRTESSSIAVGLITTDELDEFHSLPNYYHKKALSYTNTEPSATLATLRPRIHERSGSRCEYLWGYIEVVGTNLDEAPTSYGQYFSVLDCPEDEEDFSEYLGEIPPQVTVESQSGICSSSLGITYNAGTDTYSIGHGNFTLILPSQNGGFNWLPLPTGLCTTDLPAQFTNIPGVGDVNFTAEDWIAIYQAAWRATVQELSSAWPSTGGAAGALAALRTAFMNRLYTNIVAQVTARILGMVDWNQIPEDQLITQGTGAIEAAISAQLPTNSTVFATGCGIAQSTPTVFGC